MTEAPRWRLLDAHYINVEELPDGTRVEWEHKETNRANGRTIRKLFPVPMLLEPKDPADHNYPGEIIVCRRDDNAKMYPQDIVMLGDPTQGMEPLNEAAEAITDSLRQKWINPIETLPANGGMNEAEMKFFQNMMQTFAGQAQPQPNSVVPKAEFDALKAELESIKAMLTKPAEGATSAVRRA